MLLGGLVYVWATLFVNLLAFLTLSGATAGSGAVLVGYTHVVITHFIIHSFLLPSTKGLSLGGPLQCETDNLWWSSGTI